MDSQHTVLIADAVNQKCDRLLEERGITVVRAVGVERERLLDLIEEADGMIVRSAVQVDAGMIDRMSRMRAIGRAGTGVDNIDVDAATEKGVVVMNVADGNTVSVAEHTVAVLLAAVRHIPAANGSLRDGKWDRKSFTGIELRGKQCGILGLGRIGREVARRLVSFDMRIVAHDPVLSDAAIADMGVEPVTFDSLIENSDVITVHIPLLESTRGLIDRDRIARMRDGVVILNCARGGIIDEDALLEGLGSGQVGAAALDVYTSEPPALPSPLIDHPNVVATPHIAASTREAQERIAVAIAEQMADFLEGNGASGVVNAAELEGALDSASLPFMRAAERLGALLGQLVGNHDVACRMTAHGRRASEIVRGLGASCLAGMLGLGLDSSVNPINAPTLAERSGVSIATAGEGPHPFYNTLIIAEASANGKKRTAAMTVFGTSEVRLVMLDGVWLDVRPVGTILLFENQDRPGVLAEVSNALAKHQVNIADVTLGRIEGSGLALTVMRVDGDLKEAALVDLSRLSVISGIRTLHFDSPSAS